MAALRLYRVEMLYEFHKLVIQCNITYKYFCAFNPIFPISVSCDRFLLQIGWYQLKRYTVIPMHKMESI